MREPSSILPRLLNLILFHKLANRTTTHFYRDPLSLSLPPSVKNITHRDRQNSFSLLIIRGLSYSVFLSWKKYYDINHKVYDIKMRTTLFVKDFFKVIDITITIVFFSLNFTV